MFRVLVAGIGNIFLGDDGFGVEVARRLAAGPLPAGVDVQDFGIRGIHLAYAMSDGTYDAAILVDAVPRGGDPGTLYAIEPVLDGRDADPGVSVPDGHSLTPGTVLGLLQRIGGGCQRVVIVGCEPASLEESMELSPAVAASVDPAMQMVRDYARELSAGRKESDAPCA